MMTFTMHCVCIINDETLEALYCLVK